MSYAYDQLRLAMQYLTQSAPLHERLAKALNESLCLRPKDLPMACRSEFSSLSSRFSLHASPKRNTELATKLQVINEQEAHAIVQTLIHLFDTVTRYQPLPPLEVDRP
jgi:hypothetical protein